MAVDLTIWKEKLAARLPDWKSRMKQAGVNSTYAFISAAALWPVVEAARQGEWAAVSALGAVLAGLGSNLLANQIQGWKDEADAARHLEKAAAGDAPLRAELDAVLAKLEALPLAEQALSAADRAWFTRTMKEELARLGSRVTYQATVTGGGAIAQGKNATAVGAGGMYIGGSVKGDVVLGDKVTGDQIAGDKIAGDKIAGNKVSATNGGIAVGGDMQNNTVVVARKGSQVIIDDSQKAEQARLEAARRQYLERLSVYCQALPLAALDDPEAETEIKLDDVYIALNTTAEIEPPQKEKRSPLNPEKQPLAAWDAFLKAPRLALLGSPGSGKSTFVRKALALQARALLHKQPLPGVAADLLPILVTLSDLIPRLEALDVDKLSTERKRAALLAALRLQIEADLQADGLYPAPAFAPTLVAALDCGAVLLALDGLDELPERLRERAQELFTALLAACHPQRVVLTCRVRSYIEGVRRKDFQDFALAPLTRQQINDFCRAWYRTRLGQRDPESARLRGESLASAALDGKLRSLAENPMLLTAMAIVHFKETRLPNERVKLYSKVVEILLERWQRHKGTAAQALSPALEKLLSDSKNVRAILERLAYQAHQVGKGKDEAADLPGQATRELLAGEFLNRDYNLAAEFLDYVDQSAGLLMGRGGATGQPASYAFAHRTFQEYLAGCYIANLRRPEKEIAKLALEPEFWSLAVQFGAEELFFNGLTRSRDDMLDLAEALFEPGMADVIQRRTALWAGKMLAVAGAEIVNQRCPGLVERLIPAMQTLLSSDLASAERAEAGQALAKLGDPRPEVMTVDAMPFCFVPEGKFMMGSKKDEKGSYGDEQPQHKVNLPAFWIGRYPVTNAQFAEFVRAGGYAEKRYWPEAIRDKRWENGRILRTVYTGEWVNEDGSQPYAYGEPFNLPNHPVVGVTWYEALAFCRWLEDQLKASQAAAEGFAEKDFWQGLVQGKLHLSLPSEAEWEKAARGPLVSSSVEVRAYPWGDTFDPNKANTGETGIGTTSAVGCFPGGASPCGAWDMSGNVWEWTRSLSENYPYPEDEKGRAARENLQAGPSYRRVLRGGSFDGNARGARCAYRFRLNPDFRNNLIGFRLVVSHTSLHSKQ